LRPIVGCALLLATASFTSAEPSLVDWRRTTPEILQHFSALLRIDTTNPPGNETRAARYLKQVLDEEGIANELLALEPDRANLVARIKGNGRKRPLLFMGHTDVVGVQRERWSVEPFSAVHANGMIYGRGAIDDKESVTAGLMLMLMLKRLNIPLDRDVIFVAEAGEEGSTKIGIDFLLEKHWPQIDAEFAFAEGGGGTSDHGEVRTIIVSTTEKVPRGLTLRARGTSGHGSVPRTDNVVTRLARAVDRVSSMTTPVRLNETTRTYFERLASVSSPELASQYRRILEPKHAAAAARYFARREPAHESMVRTTIVPTLLQAGFRENVIPSDGEAMLDIRALPDEDIPLLLARIRYVIDDTGIELVPRRGRPAAPPSRLNTEAFEAIERVQRRMYPQAITLPSMLTGASDLAQLRARGIQCYGVGPVSDAAELGAHGAHADDERLPEAALIKFVQFIWSVAIELGASK